MDVAARQLVLTQLKRAETGDTQSRELLKMAQDANMTFMSTGGSALEGRRAVLARRAYDTRVNSVVGRVRAAYALLAENEGNTAISARQAAARVTLASQKEVFIVRAKNAELRRNIMLQAQQAAEKAFDAAPGLPESIGGKAGFVSSAQVTLGITESYRPPSYISRTNDFFPADIRAAAGSLKGFDLPGASRGGTDSPLGWLGAVEASIEADAQKVEARAHELAKQVTAQEAGTSNLSVQAESLVTQLRDRQANESQNGIPYLHIAAGIVLGVVIKKVFL